VFQYNKKYKKSGEFFQKVIKLFINFEIYTKILKNYMKNSEKNCH